MRYLLCLFAAILFIFTFSACIDEDLRSFYEKKKAENAASSEALKKAASSTISENSVLESSSDESSEEQNSVSEKSGSTQIDNKPPKQGVTVKENKDGVTIHVPRSDLEKFNSELSEIRKEMEENSIHSVPEFDEFSYSSRDDLEYSEPTEWREYAESGKGNNPDKYPWENDD